MRIKRWQRLSIFSTTLLLTVIVIVGVHTPITEAQYGGDSPANYGGGQINPNAPACAYHNPNEWHSLYDYQRGCHYDHEHKHNPGILYAGMPADERAEAEAMLRTFGKPGDWFGGTSISYPWQTFQGANEHYPDRPSNPQVLENNAKHEGYGWLVRYDIPQKGRRTTWIKDFRLQYHAIFAGPGALTRFHSYSLEANVCRQLNDCRVIRTGGWADFGDLTINGKPIFLGGQFVNDQDRRRLHFTMRDTAEFAGDPYRVPAFWYGIAQDIGKRAPWDNERPFIRLSFAIASKDVWSNINRNNPYWNDLFCPDFQCNKNSSTIQAHSLQFSLQSTGYEGWTDRYGRFSQEKCFATGLDCIPTVIEPGDWRMYVHYRDISALGYNAEGQRDFDVSPSGLYWIEYPN